MPLTLYNTLTRRKEAFLPLDPSNVRVYVCGPTVYDDAHIGNARAVVVFDLLYRVLRLEYGADHVTYVRNITDVEDKIMAAARARGTLPPDTEPRATEYIKEMIALVERLIASGHAYAAEGHALFRVGSYARYGALSRRSRADMIAGARVEVAPYKEDPGDFVLWKPSTPDQPGWDSPWGRGRPGWAMECSGVVVVGKRPPPGQPGWESPGGRGRPGWHIECSAMSEDTLGETFDIHGGGLDLIFPHHENEIAQSVCAHAGRPFARYWMHNGMLTVGGAKMAKSEGNFVTVREVLAEAPGEVIRLALLVTHYRDPLDWTPDKLRQARQSLDRFYRALTLPRDPIFEKFGEANAALGPVHEALEDDLNAPLALTRLHDLAGAINRTSSDAERSALQTALERGGRLMGFLEANPLDWLRGSDKAEAEQTEQRIDARAVSRRQRHFGEADPIRAELAAEGVILEDK